MSIFATLTSMNLPEDTVVNLSYSEGADVFHFNETEVETALEQTDVVENVSALLATPGLALHGQHTVEGRSILENLREDGLLENYDRGAFSFSEYLSETISENFYDLDLIEYSTEKYDHKRGFTTLSTEVQCTLDNFLAAQPSIFGWEVSVKTDKGLLVLG